MCYLRKVLVQITTHTHSGRILIFIFRVSLLQILKFTHLVIKLLIRYFRSIQHVIIIVMPMKFSTQFLYFSFYIHISLIV